VPLLLVLVLVLLLLVLLLPPVDSRLERGSDGGIVWSLVVESKKGVEIERGVERGVSNKPTN
jgi:hypothetical protein